MNKRFLTLGLIAAMIMTIAIVTSLDRGKTLQYATTWGSSASTGELVSLKYQRRSAPLNGRMPLGKVRAFDIVSVIKNGEPVDFYLRAPDGRIHYGKTVSCKRGKVLEKCFKKEFSVLRHRTIAICVTVDAS
jgi:hypothetical protein